MQNQESCPKCNGRGRIKVDATGWEAHPGLVCGLCDGTGDADRARLVRAYRFGYADGVQAMRDAIPNSGLTAAELAQTGLPKHYRQIWQGNVLDGC